VPVHMGGLLFLAFFVGLEASSTLITWCAKPIIETRDEVGSGSGKVLETYWQVKDSFLHLQGAKFQNNIVRYLR
jgi:hypothetical protein